MSQDIIREITFFLHSVCMGVIITFVYDWFLILRKLIRHNMFWLSLEDFLFWAACGLGVFYMLYRENNGVLRWFTVLGAVLGMVCYKWLVSRWFVHIMSICIYKILWLLFSVIQVIVKPLKWLFSRLYRLMKRIGKKLKKGSDFVKKKLTGCIKLLKIVLCKR